MSDTDNKTKKTLNDFTVGLVTFVLFLVFMTSWMYLSV